MVYGSYLELKMKLERWTEGDAKAMGGAERHPRSIYSSATLSRTFEHRIEHDLMPYSQHTHLMKTVQRSIISQILKNFGLASFATMSLCLLSTLEH